MKSVAQALRKDMDFGIRCCRRGEFQGAIRPCTRLAIRRVS